MSRLEELKCNLIFIHWTANILFNKIVFILILLFNSLSYSQGISELVLLDGFSLPLTDGDDGIRFQYTTTSSGQLSAYLKTNYFDFRLFSDKKEFKHLGFIIIGPAILKDLCKYKDSFYTNASLHLTHISSRASHYSYKELPLKIDIEAPYGCEIEEYPNKPNLHAINLTKSIIQPLPAIGLISGGGLIIAGFIIDIGNQENGEVVDKEKQEKANKMMGVGAALFAISYLFLNKIIPDTENNEINKIRNHELLYDWEKEYNSVVNNNQLIKATYKIRFSIQ